MLEIKEHEAENIVKVSLETETDSDYIRIEYNGIWVACIHKGTGVVSEQWLATGEVHQLSKAGIHTNGVDKLKFDI